METQDSRNQAIRQELDHILSSGGFSRNDRQSQFLRFLVERHLDGRDSELKESVIGVEVFGREPGYDPKLDAIVRTEAIRLRTRLEKYYSSEGSADPLIIDLPKGAYKPAFHARPTVQKERKARPTRTWWITSAVAAVVLAVSGTIWWRTHTSEASFSVAVLPLENLDRNPDADYFADGLTDEIIRNLSVIDGLTVRSRTSSFALKGKSLNAGEAGTQLEADYLVEGSVQHAGDDLRVNVALIRARDDFRMWSERFDRKLTDVFAIQDEISRGVVNTLRLRLSPGRRRYEANLEAYDLYLRARQLMASFPTQGRPIAKPAIEYFEQAIGKDPNYAIAYAGMADALIAVERNMGAASAATGGIARARAAAERAVQLDPLLSEAHSAMASVRAREYAWREAEQGFRRAIDLNPNNALAHLELGVSVLVIQERFEEGLDEVRRAVGLDPLSPYVNTEFGRALILTGHYDEAIAQLRKTIALEPSRNRPYTLLARALSLQGKNAEALKVRDDAVKRGAQLSSGPAADELCVLARLGRRDEVLAIIQQQPNAPGAGTRRAAQTYACLGDADRTLEYLEKALAANEPNLPEIVQSPDLAWMRTNPRFATLRQKLNLDP